MLASTVPTQYFSTLSFMCHYHDIFYCSSPRFRPINYALVSCNHRLGLLFMLSYIIILLSTFRDKQKRLLKGVKMRLKKLSVLAPAVVLSSAALLNILVPQLAHATPPTLYWCNTAGSNFNTASNWNTNSSCSGGTNEVPATGDNLVFDVTNLSADATVDDDISGLSVGSITFQGSNSSGYYYTIASSENNTLTVTGGITQSSVEFANIKLNLTLSGAQSITNTNLGSLAIGDSSGITPTTLSVGTSTITMVGNTSCAATNIYSSLSGSGVIDDNYTTGGVSLNTDSPSFTGTINVNGSQLVSNSSQALGSSAATTVVASGASLALGYSANTSFPENISLDGTGPSNVGTIVTEAPQDMDCGAGGGTGYSTTYVATLTGTVTLQSNATILTNQGYDLDVDGPLSGDFTLTAAPNSAGTLTIDSSDNTSNTPNTATNSSSANAPSTPDTGFALASAHPIVTLGVASLSALFIAGLAYYNNHGFSIARTKTKHTK